MADVQDERRALADEIADVIAEKNAGRVPSTLAATTLGCLIFKHAAMVDAALREPSGCRAGAEARGPFRTGRKVPCNVYENNAPAFMAKTDADAARYVALLNAGLDRALTPEAGQAEGGEHA